MRPEAYPHPVESVRVIETHISWVLLTGEFAYKIKRPVRYPFVDLTSVERRAFFCAEELRLNRRFAPELYLEVCEIRESKGLAHIGGEGRLLDHCVRMREFPRDAALDRLLQTQQVAPEELERFGRDLAGTHARLPAAGAEEPWGRPARIRGLVLENLDEAERAAAALGTQDAVRELRPAFEMQLHAAGELMETRRRMQRVRECHGDLHARNVVRSGTRLRGFDCMEFEPAFRWIDVAQEVGLLHVDLEAREARRHAHAFLAGYLAASRDYAMCRLLGVYEAHGALVRAKVASLAFAGASDEAAAVASRAEHDMYLGAARGALASKTPRLVLVSGLSGSGKTWLATRLASHLGAIHLRSDVERKHAAGLDERASSASGVGKGLYTPEITARVYAQLAHHAQDLLAGGCSAIVDATFSKQSQRAAFTALARSIGVPLHVLECHAPLGILRERIVKRHAARTDASEADLAVLDWQLKSAEPIQSAEALNVWRIDTSRADAEAEALRALGASR